MSLAGAYGWGLGTTLVLALLSVLLGGELPSATWLALPAVGLSFWLRARRIILPGYIGPLIGGVAFVAGLLQIVDRGVDATLLGGGIALIGILAGRVLTSQTPAHDSQALLLSLLLVLSGSALHTQFTYGIVFVAYALSMAWALVTRQMVAGAHLEGVRLGRRFVNGC
ncbi:MAG: hypothetical protein R3C68_15650 [Myxococcota bacterium]